MLRLQDVKVGLAEAALGEGTGSKLHKLSVRDIKFVSSYRLQSHLFISELSYSFSE